MSFDTENTEPKACITLRLGEIDTLIGALGDHNSTLGGRLDLKLRKMRAALVKNAAANVPAIREDWARFVSSLTGALDKPETKL